MDIRVEQFKKYDAQFQNHPDRVRIMKEVNRDLFGRDLAQPGDGKFERYYPEAAKEREKEKEKFEYFQQEKKKKREAKFKVEGRGSGHIKIVTQKQKTLKALAREHPKIFNEEDYE